MMNDVAKLRSTFEDTACNLLFEFTLGAVDGEGAEVSMPVAPSHLQEMKVVHGGIITTLADTAAVYALLPHLPEGKRMTSIELKINFLNPAVLGGGELSARSRVVKRGRRVSLCDVEVAQGDTLVAKGQFTYLW